MKIIHNNILPMRGFGLMNILGLVFSRKPASEVTLRSKRHEQTHTLQQYELLMVAAIVSLVLCNVYASWWYLLGVLAIPFGFYVFGFVLEMVVPPYHNAKIYFAGKCFCDKVKAVPAWMAKVWMDAYRDNCFEREAYMNDNDRNYLATRRLFGWVWYIMPRADRIEGGGCSTDKAKKDA